jgi:hypothetical protein
MVFVRFDPRLLLTWPHFTLTFLTNTNPILSVLTKTNISKTHYQPFCVLYTIHIPLSRAKR